MSLYYVSVLTVLDDGAILERAGKIEAEGIPEILATLQPLMPSTCLTSVVTMTKFKPELQVEIVEEEERREGYPDGPSR